MRKCAGARRSSSFLQTVVSCLSAAVCTLLVAEKCFASPDSVLPRQKILAAAEQSVGKKMWYGFGLSSGKLGCAAALSNVLSKSGINVARSAAVVVVRRQLLKSSLKVKETRIKNSKGYGVDVKKLQSASQPGDLIFGYMSSPERPNIGPDAHCGVVAAQGEVFANDWNDGIWKRVEADKFFAWYPYLYVMQVDPGRK